MAALSASIKGLQRLQARNVRRVAALKPSGAAGRAVRDATATAHRYAVAITHVDTGSWRASHRMVVSGDRLAGVVGIPAGAINPRSRRPVEEYARVWEERGGRLAVYKRTSEEAGPEILRRMGRAILFAVVNP